MPTIFQRVFKKLTDLLDVAVTSPSDGQVLKYSASAGKWQNANTSETDITNLQTDLAAKADKVSSPTSGHFASLTAGGDLADSGKKATDFANAVHTHSESDVTNLTTDLAAKANKVASPTAGHLASLTSGGDLADSSFSVNNFIQGATFGGTEWQPASGHTLLQMNSSGSIQFGYDAVTQIFTIDVASNIVTEETLTSDLANYVQVGSDASLNSLAVNNSLQVNQANGGTPGLTIATDMQSAAVSDAIHINDDLGNPLLWIDTYGVINLFDGSATPHYLYADGTTGDLWYGSTHICDDAGNIFIASSNFGTLTCNDDGSEQIVGAWGLNLKGNATHPVQIPNTALLVGISAAGGSYTSGTITASGLITGSSFSGALSGSDINRGTVGNAYLPQIVHPGAVSANFYPCTPGTGSSGSGVALSADTIYFVPFWIPPNTTVAKVAINVTSAAASGKHVRVGIYNNSGGVPTTVVSSSTATQLVDSTGQKNTTITPAALSGWYWLAIQCEAAVTLMLQTPTQTAGYYIGFGSVGFNGILQLNYSAAYSGGLPTITAGSLVRANNNTPFAAWST